MGIRHLNLRSSQVRKMGKISLNAGFSFFKSFYHPNNRFKIFLLFAPLQISSNKESILGYKNMEGEFSPLELPSYACDPLNRRLAGLQSRSGYF